MARTNIKKITPAPRTHEGAVAARIPALEELRRSTQSCMLFEGEFYESGEAISARIMRLAKSLPPQAIADLAIETREIAKLRHVPLLLLVALCKTGSGQTLVSDTIARVIKRADEMGELIALYKKINGKNAALSAGLKKGLSKAFVKFDEYQLAKYDREGEYRLRDVVFLAHVKPKDTANAKLIARLVNKTYFPDETKGSRRSIKKYLGLKRMEPGLETPDTWETNLSGGADKKETFERLIQDDNLGYLALLRNLRNMEQAGVSRDFVLKALEARKGAHNVLPFRYIAAARHAPQYEQALDKALIASIGEMAQMPGKTLILVDVSGSMDNKLSGKSELSRIDAASTLASIFPGADVRVFSFSYKLLEVPRRLGMSGVEAISRSQYHGGTQLISAVTEAMRIPHDRIIVISDEQATYDTRNLPQPKAKNAYMINVASNQNGVGYGSGWTHINGFSENVLRWIAEVEGVRLTERTVSEAAIKKPVTKTSARKRVAAVKAEVSKIKGRAKTKSAGRTKKTTIKKTGNKRTTRK